LSAAGERYLAIVRRLPCEICVRWHGVEASPQTHVVSSAHHPRTGAGAGRKNPDEDAIALCPYHHQNSSEALHVMGRKAWEAYFNVTEAELTLSTRKRAQEIISMEATCSA